jgi:hypothetical protein
LYIFPFWYVWSKKNLATLRTSMSSSFFAWCSKGPSGPTDVDCDRDPWFLFRQFQDQSKEDKICSTVVRLSECSLSDQAPFESKTV